MATQSSIVRWGDETEDTIVKDIFERNFNDFQKTNKWPFENDMDIVLSAQTDKALLKIFIWSTFRRFKFFSKLKEYIVNGKINPIISKIHL